MLVAETITFSNTFLILSALLFRLEVNLTECSAMGLILSRPAYTGRFVV